MMQPDIYEVELIGSGFLAVMAKPVPGEWIEDEFEGIYRKGIKQIVSLLELQEMYEVGLNKEKEITEKHNMLFTSYPIKDRGLPDSIQYFREITKSIYHQVSGGMNTVIHCRAGIGRTGLVAAGVLLHCGFDPNEAFDHISKRRGVEVPDTNEQKNWLINNYGAILKGST